MNTPAPAWPAPEVDWRARVRSWGWDYLLLSVWLLGVSVVAGVGLALLGSDRYFALWGSAVAADFLVFLLTVAPVVTYLTWREAGPRRAGIGKRRMGLVVLVARTPAWQPVLLRNAVKFAPWQLGHMAALRYATGEPSSLAHAYLAASLLLLLLVIGPALASRRGLHDWLAGTQVLTDRAAHPENTASRNPRHPPRG